MPCACPIYFCDKLCVIEFHSVHPVIEEPSAVRNIFGGRDEGGIVTTHFNDGEPVVNGAALVAHLLDSNNEYDIPSPRSEAEEAIAYRTSPVQSIQSQQVDVLFPEHSSQGEWYTHLKHQHS